MNEYIYYHIYYDYPIPRLSYYNIYIYIMDGYSELTALYIMY